MDRALNVMALDTERIAKNTVPVGDTGELKSGGHHIRIGHLNWQVRFGHYGPSTPYARYQEFGGDGRRVVRRYSRPGKKAHFLRDAGIKTSNKIVQYIKEQVRGIRV